MKKRKSIWMFVLAICLIVPTMFMLSACGKDNGGNDNANEHTHTYSQEWTTDNTYHWHQATCEHAEEKDDYGEHTVTTWTEKTPAGLHINKVEQGTCTVCEKVVERTVENTATHTYANSWSKDGEKHWKESTCEGHNPVLKIEEENHTYGEWKEKTSASFHKNKVEERKCTVCDYVQERTVENTATHKWASTYSHDKNQHWKESTCEGHTPALKAEVADHTFDAWETKTPANYGVNKVEKHTCSVCGFEDEREVENSALAPKTNNVSVSAINFTYSGQKQSIDSLITVDNNTGIVVEYEGTNGTTYEKSTTAPTNAGSYKYTITIPATVEWAKGEKTGTFDIKKYKVVCPKNFISYLEKGETTKKLCDVLLPEGAVGNFEEVELTYSNPNKPDGFGAGRIEVSRNYVDVAEAYRNNFEVDISSSEQTIEWIILDETDTFSFRYINKDESGLYIGIIDHGYVKVGDKLTVLDFNSAKNIFVKVGVTLTKIEYNIKYSSDYSDTTYATKGEKVKITFTKDNASDNISSVRNIVKAQDMSEINTVNEKYNSQTVDLSLGGSEFRMLKIKINTNTKCKLTISDPENSKLLKIFNVKTGAEISLSDGTFQVAEGTEVYIIIQQGITGGTQQVKVELVEYSFGA